MDKSVLANDFFVELIQNQFESYQQRNNRYSLRAFATKLQVSPSTLSEILRKKRKISKTTAANIIQILDPENSEALYHLNHLDEHYSPYKTDTIETLRIEGDEALLFEKWYHLAIVTFFDSHRYDGTPDSIANYFGISKEDAIDATSRLLRLGIINEKNGRYVNSAQFYITDRSKINDSIHVSKRHALKNALQALETAPLQDKSSFSMMFSVFDHKLVPEAIEYLDKMKRGFVKKFKGKGDKSAIYQLSMQFFPCEMIGTSEEHRDT
ncbi:hypothetical protein BDW_05715 [Bdellovibrio bacteriovorus W]|nr:hypothetical protein BDW_05715 [Bdellovibrio bacteriovorus W]